MNVSFPWLPLVAAPLNAKVRFCYTTVFFKKEFIKTEDMAITAESKLSINVCFGKMHSVLQ